MREYRYEKTYIEVEFAVRVGSKKPRADLVIFPPATNHKQENALIIVECKSAKVKSEDKKDGVGQLQSYMAVAQTSPMECGRTASSGFATDVSSKAARSLDFSKRVTKILELRNEGYRLTLEAEAQFEKALGSIAVKDWGGKRFLGEGIEVILGRTPQTRCGAS